MDRLQQCDSLSFNPDFRDVYQDDPVYTGSFSIHLEQAQRYHEQLMQLERSFRRLRLYNLQRFIYEIRYDLGMHLRVCHQRRMPERPHNCLATTCSL